MSWEKVTIAKFNGIQELVDKQLKIPEAERDTISYALDMYSLIYDSDKEKLLDLPATELTKLFDELAFLNDKPKGRVNDKIIVNGKTYKVPIDVRSITTAQYIDYTEVSRNDPGNIALMCAIFCVPEGYKYNEGYNVSELANEFYESFCILDAIGISFFFTELLKASVKSTLNYLESNLKKELNKAKKTKKGTDRIAAIEQSMSALKNAGGAIL